MALDQLEQRGVGGEHALAAAYGEQAPAELPVPPERESCGTETFPWVPPPVAVVMGYKPVNSVGCCCDRDRI